jgi:hypothetical protein
MRPPRRRQRSKSFIQAARQEAGETLPLFYKIEEAKLYNFPVIKLLGRDKKLDTRKKKE